MSIVGQNFVFAIHAEPRSVAPIKKTGLSSIDLQKATIVIIYTQKYWAIDRVCHWPATL